MTIITSLYNIKSIIYSGYREKNVLKARTPGRIGQESQAEDTEKSVQAIDEAWTSPDGSQRDRIKTVKNIILDIQADNDNRAPHEDIKIMAESKGIQDTDTIISHMVKDGSICEVKDKLYMVI